MVRAPRWVGTVSTTVYLSGVSSCTTVMLPSPFDVNASWVAGSNPLASTPAPTAGGGENLPRFLLTTAIKLLPQPAYRSRWTPIHTQARGPYHPASHYYAVSRGGFRTRTQA